MTNQSLTLTTESGAPVADNQNTQTAGPAGPVLPSVQKLIRRLDPREKRILERIATLSVPGSMATRIRRPRPPHGYRWPPRRGQSHSEPVR